MVDVQYPVVVGVDGSPAALHALGFAAAEASARGVPLQIVHAERLTIGTSSRAVLDDARARVLKRYPATSIHAVVVHGGPASVLVEASGHAVVTVVGCRGLGGLAGLVAGSVSADVATHGHGAVVVVRGPHYLPSGRPVLLGVDATTGGDQAVGYAFEEAALRAVPLRALYAWTHTPISDLGEVAPPGYRMAEVEEQSWFQLAAALAGWLEKYPGVAVTPSLVHSRHPAKKLIAAALDVDLVVVGSRGLGALDGLLGGSVGHALTHRVPCPVAIVHPDTAFR